MIEVFSNITGDDALAILIMAVGQMGCSIMALAINGFYRQRRDST
jgi:hypothetical protein